MKITQQDYLTCMHVNISQWGLQQGFLPQKQTLCINQLFGDKVKGLLLVLSAGQNRAAEFSLSWQECLGSQHGTVHAQAMSTLQHELKSSARKAEQC